MTIVHLSDLPEDVREHLALLEREGEEFPERERLEVLDERSALSDEE